MNYKIQKYDMIVGDVDGIEMRKISDDIQTREDGEDWVFIYYALSRNNPQSDPETPEREVVWARNMWIPFDLWLLDRKFQKNTHTQEDVDALNDFFTAIGAPEIKILLEQKDPEPEPAETPEQTTE